MRRATIYRFCLALIPLMASIRLIAQEPGALTSKQALNKDLPVTADHPLPRKPVAVREEVISSRPADQTILVVHYRASLEPESLNDDQVLIAVKTGDKYKLLERLNSDAGVVNGRLDSQSDFAVDFISIDGLRFLYVKQRFAGTAGTVIHLVYTISSDGVLTEIPFEEVRTSKLLRDGEELRNGATRFENGRFFSAQGIYRNDPECCPSGGTLNVVFRLAGKFEPAGQSDSFRPRFKFVIDKEWRSP